jgi:hypothetical protein
VALSVSPAIRVVALVGLLLALVAGGAMRFMGGGSGSATAMVPSQNSAVIRAKSAAAGASARAKHVAAAAAAATGTHKATTAKPKTAKTKATHPTAAKPTPVATHAKAAAKPAKTAPKAAPTMSSALPLPLAQALAFNPTVVAVLYNPQSEVDGIAVAEARAGAALAGAGFVALNVLSQRDVGKLTEQLGLLPDPAVLVFTRPAHVAARIDGFSDKETVAQAAQNAAHGT